LIIAIDGPAGSGKSTLAKLLAEGFGLLYLDTGATYRAVALAAKRKGLDESMADDVARLAEKSDIQLTGDPRDLRVFLDGGDVTREIRTPEISDLASRISTVPSVRRALVELQRRIAKGHDVVSEGRDTGSVVFPDADLKIYLDASIEERTNRRARDWSPNADKGGIMSEISRRDERDRTRADSPLKIADGAVVIDSTAITPEEVFEQVALLMRTRGLITGS
jgi:cytidylate kinase